LSFQCPHQKLWGQPCAECWKRWDEFNIHETNGSKDNGREDIERLVNLSRYDPAPPSLKRIFIVDEAHQISQQAQDLLLKPMEEPAPNTVWIIATTAPEKLKPALQRRCVKYHFDPLNVDGIRILLQRAVKVTGFAAPVAPLVEELRKSEITGPADVLMAFEHFASGQDALASVAAVRNATASKIDSYALCKVVLSGNWLHARKLLEGATADDARFVRASVAGYLRGCLLRETDMTRADRLSQALRLLMGMAPLGDAELWPWLLASLFQACKVLR